MLFFNLNTKLQIPSAMDHRFACSQGRAIFANIYVFSSLPDVRNVFIRKENVACLPAIYLKLKSFDRSNFPLGSVANQFSFFFFLFCSLQLCTTGINGINCSTVMYTLASTNAMTTPTHRNGNLSATFFPHYLMRGNLATVRCSKLKKISIIFMLKICPKAYARAQGTQQACRRGVCVHGGYSYLYEASRCMTTGTLVDMQWGKDYGSFAYMNEKNIDVGFERSLNGHSIYDEKWKSIVGHKASWCDILHMGE